MNGIEVSVLQKSFGKNRVLDGLSLTIAPGSVTGLLGPNGAGKTTLLRTMMGLSRPERGWTRFDGVEYRDLDRPCAVVGCLLDAGSHHPGRTVLETVKLHSMYAGVDPRGATGMLDAVGLGSVLTRRFGDLSLGMRQRVGLAVALSANPKYLLLDEPMNGLDIETSAWVRELILDFTHGRGGAAIISSHLLHELQTFVDDLVVLDKGRSVFQGSVKVALSRATSLVRTSLPDEFVAALRCEGIPHRTRPEYGLIEVDAPTEVVGRLAYREHLLVEELVPGDPHALETFYMSLTRGEFAATGRG